MEIPVTAIADSIKRGDILLSEFDGIDHRKFFVVMGVSEDKICGFFFINSNIHPATPITYHQGQGPMIGFYPDKVPVRTSGPMMNRGGRKRKIIKKEKYDTE